ncbi:MAG: FAD-dependent oxidoreductase, partial [Candidatus Omnitrophota bacterium]
EAVHEGVKILPLAHPIEIKKDKNGKVCGLKCIHMKLGDFDQTGRRRPTASTEDVFDMETDQVIVAIGQTMDAKKLFESGTMKLSERKFIFADPVSGKTSVEGIFAGGDVATGPSSVVMAISSGEHAAVGIDQYLTGEDHAFWRKQKTIKVDFDPDADPVPYPRDPLRLLDVARRKYNFDEVEQSWNEGVARRQAKRCLRCDYGKCLEEKGGKA